jgi:hypothetical protein
VSSLVLEIRYHSFRELPYKGVEGNAYSRMRWLTGLYNSLCGCVPPQAVGLAESRVALLPRSNLDRVSSFDSFQLSCYLPGRSTNDKSSMSLPQISKQIVFEENDICLSSRASGEASKNRSCGVLGFRMAHCARRILSVTKDFSKMGSPNAIF